MTCRVVIVESDEGFAVFCPSFPGCVSQGASEAEALENMRDAATLWLESDGKPENGSLVEAELLREAAMDGSGASVRELLLGVAA